jgi:hypothetical protein
MKARPSPGVGRHFFSLSLICRVAFSTAFFCTLFCRIALGASADAPVSYRKQVLPILMRECSYCHLREERYGYLAIDADVALDNLAKHREDGIRLGSVTVTVLDEFRPGGPSRSMNQKKPERPVYDAGVMGKPFLPLFEDISTVRRSE